MGRLKPSDLERMPTELCKLMSDLEYKIMLDIVRRIKEAGKITRSADFGIFKLGILGKSKALIKKMIQKLLKLSDKKIDDIYAEVVDKGYSYDESLYNEAGKDFIPYSENDELKQYVEALKEQSKDELKNLTNTLGVATIEDGAVKPKDLDTYYSETMDKAFNEVATGAMSSEQVIKETVEELTKSGVRSIDYASGKSERIDVATRRALSTSLGQLASHISDTNAEKLDTEYFEVSAHSTARPSHQVWQGRVFSKDDLVKVCGLGKPDGLQGINCYHNYWAFIPRNISKAVYG